MGTYVNETFGLLFGSENVTVDESSTALFTEEFTVGARLAFVTVGLIALAINIPAIIVLRKTKKVPNAGKFLSSGLLAFDALFIFFTILRKFFTDPIINNLIQVLGTSTSGLAVMSILLMATERYVLFFYPMVYLKYMTPRVTRVLASTVWIGYVFGHWVLRYGVCYMKLKTTLVFKQAGICNSITLTYMLVCLTLTTIICSYTYVNIIAFVYRKTKASSTYMQRYAIRRAIIREYKSTMFVFMCTGIMCLSFVGYVIILTLNVTKQITIEQNRIAHESVSIANCMMDPLWYVLWFKECRLEALKILALFNHKLLPKVEKMRIEIFNIVTSPCGCSSILQDRKASQNTLPSPTGNGVNVPAFMDNGSSGLDVRAFTVISIHQQNKSTIDNDITIDSVDSSVTVNDHI